MAVEVPLTTNLKVNNGAVNWLVACLHCFEVGTCVILINSKFRNGPEGTVG
jgi:hypothetical protein